jgi:hypothetical protein
MATKEEQDNAVEFFLKMGETQGVTCATVTDGHMLFFKREWLQALLDKHPTNEKFMIFVKRPDFKKDGN